MAEWETCYEGCQCSECRQRRYDYFDMIYRKSAYGITDEHFGDTELNRLNSAMDNLNYSNDVQNSIRKKYRNR